VQAEDMDYSGMAQLGRLIYSHRALFLLPELAVPFLLLNNPDLLPGPWRLAAYGLGLAGAALRIYCTGFRTWAHKSGGDRHLMTAGPYARLRHPLYIANFLLFLPVFLVANVWWITVLFTLWYWFTHGAVILREDQVLQARYTVDWVHYAGQVRRLLPRWKPYEPQRGGFSFKPILRGREPLQLAAWAAVFVLFEVFRSPLAGGLTRVQESLGLYLWS